MQDAIILYENGKAIGGEGHPTNASDITFDNAGTDLVSEEVENAIKEVNAKTSGLTRMTTLWTNQSPTASFASQSITLNSSDYDFIIWVVAINTYATAQEFSIMCEKGRNAIFSFSDTNGYYARTASYSTDTTYTVGGGYKGSTANDGVSIPLKAYGIKII